MSRLFVVLRPALVLAAAFSLYACGGGGGSVPVASSTAAPDPPPLPSPTPPAVAPGAAFTTVPATVGFATDTPLALPYGGDFPAAPTMTFSAPTSSVPAGASFAVVASSAVADDIPALDRARGSASLRAARSLPSAPLFVLSFASSVDVTLTAAPAFRFTLPQRAIVPGVRYWLALYDVSNGAAGWQYGFEGPGTLAGSVVSFAGGNPVRFPAGSRMIVVLYALPASLTPPTPAPLPSPSPFPSPATTPSAAPTPTRSPAPGATPTPAPTPGPLLLGTTAMTFTTSGATQTSSVAQANGTGSYTVSSSNPGVAIATVRGALVTVVSGYASGGSTITVAGSGGQKATIAVAVDLPGSPTFSQPTMDFNGLGETMTSTVSQSGYAGPFTVASGNSNVATAKISGSTVTVTSVAPGATTIAVTGGNRRSASIGVTVTTFSVGIHTIRVR